MQTTWPFSSSIENCGDFLSDDEKENPKSQGSKENKPHANPRGFLSMILCLVRFSFSSPEKKSLINNKNLTL